VKLQELFCLPLSGAGQFTESHVAPTDIWRR
jgi:hypothetical protein